MNGGRRVIWSEGNGLRAEGYRLYYEELLGRGSEILK